MNYKIIEFDRILGQIKVKYSHEGQNIAVYDIDVPIENKRFITGERLEKEIQDRAPTWLIQRFGQINSAENFQDVETLVTVSPTLLPMVPADLTQEA